MDKVIPIFYSDYGRHVIRYRAVPFFIDCLIPSQRRVLLGLFDTTGSKNKTIKSAKVVGHIMGEYHPHGDKAIYDTLVKMAEYTDFIITQGNWGTFGIKDSSPPAAMRYTECRLNPMWKKRIFSYYKYVSWDAFETDTFEPIYLPCIVPVGLIGSGVYVGVAAYKTVIPRYKYKSLLKRLLGLLGHISTETIVPNFEPYGCVLYENETGDFENILTKGTGKLKVVPNGEIKRKSVFVYGRSPVHSYSSLLNALDGDDKKSLIKGTFNDLGDRKNSLIGCIKLDNKYVSKNFQNDINSAAKHIWEKYLTKSIKIDIYVCDHEGKVYLQGIDNLLLTNYQYYIEAVKNKIKDDYSKLLERYFEYYVISIIRYIFDKYKISNDMNELISKFKLEVNNGNINHIVQIENVIDNNQNLVREINENVIIEICKNKSIKQLIEKDLNFKELEERMRDKINEYNNCENNIINNCKKELEIE